MSDGAIFFIGVCVSVLCVAFVVASAIGLREAGRDADQRRQVGRPPEEA